MNAIKESIAAPEESNEEALEERPSQGQAIESGTVSRGLGLARWVQYVFVLGAAFTFWFLDKVATLVWQNFAEPPTVAITAVSGIIAVAVTLFVYRQERAHTLVEEVVVELAKVTWPTRKETYASTVVVIVTSLIAAFIVGAFDYIWSTLTDFLYKHRV